MTKSETTRKRGTKSVSIAKKKGFSKFQAAMLEASRKRIMPQPDEMNALSLATKNHLFDLDGPTQTRIGPRTQKQIYSSKLFYGFMEIVDSLEMLADIAFMVGKFPYPKTRISPDRYLQFLVESHFEEIYILRERLEQYLKVIERQYKTDPRHSSIRTACTRISKLTVDVLNRVLKVRHNHVHEARFSDKDIDRLKSLGLIANNSDGDLGRMMKVYYRSEYTAVRRRWQKTMKENNKGVRQLLDFIAERLVTIIFDEKTFEFKYPAGIT